MDAVPQWAPEHEIDADTAARLVTERWPEFRGVALRKLDAGWDNTVFVADGEWAFRFPRRSIAVAAAEREIAVLPELAPELPLPIPVPRYVSRAGSADYPWPFWGGRLVPGRELAAAALPDAARERAASGVGAFLHALHDPELLRSGQVRRARLPHDPNRRGDPPHRAGLARTTLRTLAEQGIWEPDPAVWTLLAAARDAPSPDGLAVCHGDLHPRHLLVGEDGAATGVIDWGDVCLADPAIDLSLAYSAFAGVPRAALLESYGRPVPPDRELAARVLAVFLCSALAEYAAAEGRHALLAEALAGIGRAVRGWRC